MKTNEDLQRDVQNAIKWEPLLHAAEIGVTAKDGVISLTGTVDNYAKKLQAEHATKNVAGVKAVVEKIEVTGGWAKIADGEIATEVLKALEWDYQVPNDKVKVTVEKGWITLGGEVSWNYQKEAAENSINNVTGVKGVTNDIAIKPDTHNALEQKDVENALERDWSINTSDITVKVEGTKVTLTGSVGTLYQKNEAARIAWKTPGIWSVENELAVEYDYALVDE